MQRWTALSLTTTLAPAMIVSFAISRAEASPTSDGLDQQRAAQCLTMAIAYEAGFEPREGKEAVAEVILNRVRHPAYPKSVCGVVFQGSERRTGCQFTFTCDGALNRKLPASVFASAREVALAALAGTTPDRVVGATHYHADYVMPYWAPSLVNITRIGAHVFYRQAGHLPQADFRVPYLAAAEPDVTGRTTLAIANEAIRATSPSRLQPSATKAVFAPWGLPTAVR